MKRLALLTILFLSAAAIAGQSVDANSTPNSAAQDSAAAQGAAAMPSAAATQSAAPDQGSGGAQGSPAQGEALPEAASADWFWGKPIASVQWDGVVHADKRELDSTTKPYIGRDFTEELWMELQSRLYELDWFEKIEPTALPADATKAKVIINFKVKEKPSIETVRTLGNSGIKSNDVLDVVTEKGGDIYNQAKTRVDELAIRRLYLERGYPDASVSSSTSPGKTANSVVLAFTIKEGSQVAVKEIRFTGNSAVSAQTLKGKMSLKESGFLQAGAFQESKLEDDKKTIVDYYRSRGYIDAAVVDVIRSYEKDPKSAKNWLIVTIALKEGKQWLFGGISFEGNTIFPSEKLASYVSEKPGSILNYKKLVEEKAKIDDIYYESGYIFNQIDLIESRDEDKLTISYKVRIVEQDRAHIESLTIKGNTKTKDYVLYRELPLEVGDIFSKAKIMEGLRNLYNLQYFSAIEPQMFPGSAENLMDLVISVEEQNTADVEFGVTLSGLGSNDSSFPLSGIVKWDDKNFLGDGTDFSIEANGSPSTQTLTFGYTDNYFFGNRISGGFNFSIGHKVLTTGQDSIYPIFDNGVPDPFTKPQTGGYSISVIPAAYLMPYDNWDFSFGFSSGYTYHTPIGDLGLGAGLTLGVGMKDYDQDKYRPASEYLRTYDGIWRLGNKAIARVYLNDLDIAYNPSSGYYVNQKLTYAGLLPASMNLESQQYIRSDSKIEAYATLFNWHLFESWSWKMVLGAHSSFSALFPKPGQDLLVTDDWLYLDGMFNARGWDSFYGFEGKQLWDNWLELRMPIIEQVIWIDGFLDADALLTTGGLVNMTGSSPAIDSTRLSFSSLGLDDMAFSVGVGFRFSIAQFPFRFYFAWPFTIQNGAVKWMKTSPGLVISITQTLN